MPDRIHAPRVIAARRSSQLMLPILDEAPRPRTPDSSHSSGCSGTTTGTCDPGRVTELLATASREEQIIHEITTCLQELIDAQAAKRELSGLTAAEIREAVESRHAAVGDLAAGLTTEPTDASAGLSAGLSGGPPAGVAAGALVGLATVRGVSA
ncbi:hypothetical protein J2X46_003169 [Nocardioides sp. BE266]|uniref:hypothetical protein n=1 Tax=Nocardioides sp. BE266 TaxID=2817725 RepID=UPI00285AFC72|nr:hypothetical protein [Nocardioides sp. BE266]MDR7254176.1 hypothetical protein [Nocardioides sp. BE266]